jgi:hypothetical protein
MLQGSLESLCDEHDPSRQSTLHVLQVRIALHRIALHCIASHCIALHRIASHCIALAEQAQACRRVSLPFRFRRLENNRTGHA